MITAYSIPIPIQLLIPPRPSNPHYSFVSKYFRSFSVYFSEVSRAKHSPKRAIATQFIASTCKMTYVYLGKLRKKSSRTRLPTMRMVSYLQRAGETGVEEKFTLDGNPEKRDLAVWTDEEGDYEKQRKVRMI